MNLRGEEEGEDGENNENNTYEGSNIELKTLEIKSNVGNVQQQGRCRQVRTFWRPTSSVVLSVRIGSKERATRWSESDLQRRSIE